MCVVFSARIRLVSVVFSARIRLVSAADKITLTALVGRRVGHRAR